METAPDRLHRALRRTAMVVSAWAAFLPSGGRLLAQDPQHATHDMSTMRSMRDLGGVPHSRLGSGTSWIPDSSRMRMLVGDWRGWMLSLHGAAFLTYLDQSTRRGDRQVGITDWEMLMARRVVRGGVLRLDVMTSAEPFVLGGSGYPLLLQTGGTFRHSPLRDRQHPHDAVMELAAAYEHRLGREVFVSLYAGAVGEPAIGPPAYMHRPSAEHDPLAPIGHHWQDALHQSFGVVTAAVNTRSIKLEASAFNPREPDEHHLVVDYRDAKLDAYSGRVSWAPSPHVVASSWWGYLNSHDRLDPTSRMHRYGASVLTDARGLSGGRWSSTLMWAMNLHHHGGASHELIHGAPGASPHHHASSMLAETSLGVGTRGALFARVERVRKNGEELGFQGGDLTALYDVRTYTAGFTRDVARVAGIELALGARGSVNFLPASLLATYGTRTPRGFALYARVQPSHILAGSAH